MASPKRQTVAIVGAAIAGPTLALQILSHPILRARFRPVLFDQSPPPPSLTPRLPNYVTPQVPVKRDHRSGASVGIFANGLYPLYNLGLKKALLERGVELKDLSIWYAGLDGKREMLQRQMNPTWSEELGIGVMFYEWGGLRDVLLGRVIELGGQVEWNRELVGVETPTGSEVAVLFADGSTEVADLVVGADGGFSKVRKFILEQKDPKTAADAWMPHFQETMGIYGISSAEGASAPEGMNAEDQNLVFVDNGFLTTGPSPGGKIRWDLVLREAEEPLHQAEDAATGSRLAEVAASSSDPSEKNWLSAMLPNQYSPSSTLEILRRYRNVFHPTMGTLETIFDAADRIIRAPLRQRVWEEDQIQRDNLVCIGDASRLMLPTSGQGTGFSIEDATVLANTLLKHATSESEAPFREALTEYARSRVPRSKKMTTVSSLARQWSVGSAWYWRAMRYYGVKYGPGGRDLKTKAMGDRWPYDARFSVEGGKA